MLGYQAVIKDTDGSIIDESEVYDGGRYFIMTVDEMISQLKEGMTLEVKRVPK